MRTLIRSAAAAAALLVPLVVSAPSAGGAIEITRSGVGRYQVRFHGMAGTGGVAHVGAYGNNSICTIGSWGPSLGDEVVHLRCFTAAGVPADSRFIAHVTNRTDGPVRGHLWSSDPTPPVGGYTPPAQYSFDSTGAPITVAATGVGRYTVALGAFGQDSAGLWASGALRVTAYGPSPAHCQVLDPALFPDPQILRVRCHGPDVLAGWASNGGAAPSVAMLGVGDYVISFPGAGAAGGHAFAGIIGTPPMYCAIQSWTAAGGAMNLHVRCFSPGGGAPNPAVLHNAGFFG